MRVLLVSKALVVGQYQSKLEFLARAPGMELTAVVPPNWRDERGTTLLLERSFTQGYHLVVSPVLLNGSFHLHFYPQIGQILSRVQPEIVHIDEEAYNLASAHILWEVRRHAPRARTLFFTWQNLDRNYPLPFRQFEQYVYDSADFALAGTGSAAAVLRRKGFRKPIAVIPQFGVNEHVFVPRPRAPGEPFVIGYAGRLVEEKGVSILLDALARLAGDWRARIVGGGPERDVLMAQSRRMGLDRIQFDTPRPSSGMPAWLNEISVLVLPSVSRPNWTEQFGRILVEAMSCQVPVVGSTCGEIPSVIGDGGLVFPEGDADALAALLGRLQGDPDLSAQLGRQGRARVLALFTQEQVARETACVYSKVLTLPRSAG